MSRIMTIPLTIVVNGVKQPDTGRTVTIVDVNGNTISTAVETPSNSGQYTATFTEVNIRGFWYRDGVQLIGYNDNSPFWLGTVDFVSGSGLSITGNAIITGNETLGGNISSVGFISASSYVSASAFVGDGSKVKNVVSSSYAQQSTSASSAVSSSYSFTATSASYAQQATSASSAISASYANSGSFAQTSSFVNSPLHENIVLTGSLAITGSVQGTSFQSTGPRFNTPGDQAFYYLGDMVNWVNTTFGGNVQIHAAGQTNGIQAKQNNDWLGIGKDPTVALDVVGDISASNNIYPQGVVKSLTFNGAVDPILGYALSNTGTPAGLLQINTVRATNLHTKVFTADTQRADNGAMILVKTTAEATGSFIMSGVGTSFTFSVKSFSGQPNVEVFAFQDFIRIPTYQRNGSSLDITNDNWAQINVAHPIFDATGLVQTWQAVVKVGGATSIQNGSLVLDYGQANYGSYEIYAVPPAGQGTSPFNQITTWATTPYTDQKVVLRQGELTGITTSPALGSKVLSGVGFYASGSAYLEGTINATNGNIAGFGITAPAISSSNNALQLFSNGNITGSQVFFTGGKIGGWVLGPNSFTTTFTSPINGLNTANIQLDGGAGANSIYYFDNGITEGSVRWCGIGQLYDGSGFTNEYGVGMLTYRGGVYNKEFWLSQTSKSIAGWSFDNAKLYSANISLNSSTEKIIAGNSGGDSSGTNIRSVFGKYDGTNYGIRAWDGTNTYFELSSDNTKDTIAGWRFNTSRFLSSGNIPYGSRYGYVQLNNLSSSVDFGWGFASGQQSMTSIDAQIYYAGSTPGLKIDSQYVTFAQGTSQTAANVNIYGQLYINAGNSALNPPLGISGYDPTGGNNIALQLFDGIGWASAWHQTSDRLLKDDIQYNVTSSLDILAQLKPATYMRKGFPKQEIGFIAQDVEDILPNIVGKDGRGMKGMDYNQLIPLLVSAVKELSEQIKELKS